MGVAAQSGRAGRRAGGQAGRRAQIGPACSEILRLVSHPLTFHFAPVLIGVSSAPVGRDGRSAEVNAAVCGEMAPNGTNLGCFTVNEDIERAVEKCSFGNGLSDPILRVSCLCPIEPNDFDVGR
jgi:hypothetical protein